MTAIRTIDQFVWGWEGWQQEQIREGAGNAGAALYQGERTLESLAELRAKVLVQQTQIEELGVLVGMMVKLLADSGALDNKVLHYRVEAELDALAETRAAARAASLTPSGPQARCVRCDQMVPVTKTTMTYEGPTCDGCMASGL